MTKHNLQTLEVMAESKKRKLAYVDRAQTLTNSRKLPNVVADTEAIPCERNRKYTFACKFKHRITVPNNEKMLDAIVLENGICVLVTRKALHDVRSAEFHANLSTDGVSGRLKKGAQNIKAGSIVCEIACGEKEVKLQLCTPVGGKLLELNSKLSEDTSLLADAHDSSGYIAVIYPDTEIPSLDGHRNHASLMESCAGRVVEKGKCFSFQQGTCTRGDKCRFKHN